MRPPAAVPSKFRSLPDKACLNRMERRSSSNRRGINVFEVKPSPEIPSLGPERRTERSDPPPGDQSQARYFWYGPWRYSARRRRQRGNADRACNLPRLRGDHAQHGDSIADHRTFPQGVEKQSVSIKAADNYQMGMEGNWIEVAGKALRAFIDNLRNKIK